MSRYFSEAGVREAVERINGSQEHLALAQNLTGTVVLLALDDPDGKDVMTTYVFDRGRCTDWTYEAEQAPSGLRDRPFKPMVDGLVRVVAAYQTFVKLDKGEIDPADALESPDYQVEANRIMILPLMQALDSWNREVREIAKEY